MSSAGTAWLSRTRTVKFHLPFFVGVPLITPVTALSPSPGGRAPDDNDQLYGVVPPVAIRVWL